MQRFIKILPLLSFLAVPLFTFAQSIPQIYATVKTTLDYIIGLLFVLGTVVFLWGVVVFIASAGDIQKGQKAKSIMTWGIVGLFVMAAAWGIAALLFTYFGIPPVPPQPLPPAQLKPPV